MQGRSSKQASEEPAAWGVRVGAFLLTEIELGAWLVKKKNKDYEIDIKKSLLEICYHEGGNPIENQEVVECSQLEAQLMMVRYVNENEDHEHESHISRSITITRSKIMDMDVNNVFF